MGVSLGYRYRLALYVLANALREEKSDVVLFYGEQLQEARSPFVAKFVTKLEVARDLRLGANPKDCLRSLMPRSRFRR